ncbi:FitA-like ribbon-helix-helix domain-containing protein [Salinisphaera sp. SPP-AMP-43]|uniref:FitA-like ribbon-helix-helix domain-containing protein n=1 Tax=Salinisphaera sp. SPP-AMP-43 TaxID=3121288 RepID=UPI003C6E116F
MSSFKVTIDEDLLEVLRASAARHRRSVAEEANAILNEVLVSNDRLGLRTRIKQRFEAADRPELSPVKRKERSRFAALD